MIVAHNELAGSIGGGVMEIGLVEQAKWKMENGKWKMKAEVIEQVHRKNFPDSSGMICSGRQTVILFQLCSVHLQAVETIIRKFENNQNCRLQIANYKLQILDKPPEGGTRNDGFKFQNSGENEFVYEENLGLKNKLFIIGGGHCALALSELMSKMDFYISLFDDREQLNTLAKNEFVHEKRIIESYEKIGEYTQSGDNVYVVVMTLGYKFDEIVIKQLIDNDFKYFGVLGSRAKMKFLLKTLANEGFDKENLARIHTPIGLPINSQTPTEIAVSIAAEIIKVKNSKV